jgi:hypothetical protein
MFTLRHHKNDEVRLERIVVEMADYWAGRHPSTSDRLDSRAPESAVPPSYIGFCAHINLLRQKRFVHTVNVVTA